MEIYLADAEKPVVIDDDVRWTTEGGALVVYDPLAETNVSGSYPVQGKYYVWAPNAWVRIETAAPPVPGLLHGG